MNSHLSESALFFINIGLLVILTVYVIVNARRALDSTYHQILTATAAAILIAATAFSLASAKSDWYSPVPARLAARALVNDLNDLRPPANPHDFNKDLTLAESMLTAFTRYTVSSYQVSTSSATIHLQGDSALMCVSYDPSTTNWAYSKGACSPPCDCAGIMSHLSGRVSGWPRDDRSVVVRRTYPRVRGTRQAGW